MMKTIVVMPAPGDGHNPMRIELDKISVMMCTMTVSSALLLSAPLNLCRFEFALKRLVLFCPWLAGQISFKDSDDVSVTPRVYGATDIAGNTGFLQCEVCDRSTEVYTISSPAGAQQSSVRELLPCDIDTKMTASDLTSETAHGLPVAALRLTQFKTSAVLSYRLNHALFDQSSIVYLFTFLSHLYSLGSGSGDAQAVLPIPTMAIPVFNARAHLAKDVLESDDDAGFEARAPLGYTSKPVSYRPFLPPNQLKIVFNASRIDELRRSSLTASGATASTTGDTASRLSTNDFINAIVARALVRNGGSVNAVRDADADPDAADTDTKEAMNTKCFCYRVCFAHNMRVPLGLGAENIGDYVRVERLALVMLSSAPASSNSSGGSAEPISAVALSQLSALALVSMFPVTATRTLVSSICDLAKRNRAVLMRMTADTTIRDVYASECYWFLNYHKYNPPGAPIGCDFLCDSNAAIVTNWSSFPYEAIRFENNSGKKNSSCTCVCGVASTVEPKDDDSVITVTELLLEETSLTPPCGCFVRISFRGNGSHRVLYAVVDSIDSEIIDNFKVIAKHTGLYTCE